MPEYLLTQLQQIMRTARDVYGVDPVIFLALYLGCTPFWYYSLFRVLKALALPPRGERVADARVTLARPMMLWITVFMIATVLPFLYVMLFGRNLPWWVYLLIAALVAQGAYGLVRKMRSQSPARS